MTVVSLRYEAEGWGTGELWAADGRLVWHELPRPGPPRASSRFERSEKSLTQVRRQRVGSVTIAGLVERFRSHLTGNRVSYSGVELDLEWCTPFGEAVAWALRAIPYGETVTYGELALLAGHQNAHRAAGSFCAQNRYSLVLPCHRVVAADGLGAYGSLGVETKRRLLELEHAL